MLTYGAGVPVHALGAADGVTGFVGPSTGVIGQRRPSTGVVPDSSRPLLECLRFTSRNDQDSEEESEKEKEADSSFILKTDFIGNKSNRTTMRPLGIYLIGISIHNLNMIHFLMISGDFSVFSLMVMDIQTDIRTYGRTYGRTDRPSYRDARTHLKILKLQLNRTSQDTLSQRPSTFNPDGLVYTIDFSHMLQFFFLKWGCHWQNSCITRVWNRTSPLPRRSSLNPHRLFFFLSLIMYGKR